MKKSNITKVISICLVLIITLSVSPVAFAAQRTEFLTAQSTSNVESEAVSSDFDVFFLFHVIKRAYYFIADLINPIYVEYQQSPTEDMSIKVQKKRGSDLIIADDLIFQSPDPSVIFQYWLDDNGDKYNADDVYSKNKYLHLTAVYVDAPIPSFTVTYDDGCNGLVFNPKTFTCEKGLETPVFGENLKRDIYEFTGWSPEISPTVTDDITYTAQWTKIFDYNIIPDETASNTLEITGYTGTANNVVIPAEIDGKPVVRIGDEAFKNNKNITSVTIPDSVTSIGDSAFYGCSKLISIEIPSYVTSIGSTAFSVCDSLTDIFVEENNSNYKSIDGVLFDFDIRTLIQYPIGNPRTSYEVPYRVTKIRSGAFASCKNLSEIGVYDADWGIEEGALDNCNFSKIKCWSGSDMMRYAIDNNISYVCYDITFEMNGNTITAYTGFSTEFFIPSKIDGTSVEHIAANAFCNSRVMAVVIPDGITSIGDYAFGGCDDLGPVIIPDSVTTIGDDVFKDSPFVFICCNPGSAAETYAKNNNIVYQRIPTSASVDGVYITYADVIIVTDIVEINAASNARELEYIFTVVYSDGTEATLTPDQYVVANVPLTPYEELPDNLYIWTIDGTYSYWW